MKDWLIEFGNFKESKDILAFKGEKSNWQPTGSNEIQIISALGQALYSKK